MRTTTWVWAMLWSGWLVQAATDWPQFRGPAGDGHAPGSRYPLDWSETNHVRWKVDIHGKGWSSPVVGGGKVWVSTATEDGRSLSVVGVDVATGKIVFDRQVFEVAAPQFCHKFNSYASPTPVLEGDRLYVSFGSPGIVCLDTGTGRVVWERRDFVCNHFRGAGASPILEGDLLIVPFDGSDFQFLAALDKRTGRTVWRKDRSIDFKDLDAGGKPEAEGDFRKAFATPHVIEVGGVRQLISQGAKAVYAYAARTGEELWRVEERSAHSGSTRPVYGAGLLFVPTGFSRGQLLAIRPGSGGATLDANAEGTAGGTGGGLSLAWKSKRNVPNKPSLLLVGDLLFMVDDGGIASCLQATDGAEVWRERVGGNHSSAPLYAAGRLYFFSEEGKTTVVEAGRTFRVLAQNSLDDGFMASPAAVDDALILRTRTRLYRIEDR